jgi:hypothetical protein
VAWPVHEIERIEIMKKKDSELFKPLVDTSEKYLRAYCDGKQADDEKAKIALRVLSLYRQILKVEKEREQIKSEWQKVIAGVAELKKMTASKAKKKSKARSKAKRRR